MWNVDLRDGVFTQVTTTRTTCGCWIPRPTESSTAGSSVTAVNGPGYLASDGRANRSVTILHLSCYVYFEMQARHMINCNLVILVREKNLSTEYAEPDPIFLLNLQICYLFLCLLTKREFIQNFETFYLFTIYNQIQQKVLSPVKPPAIEDFVIEKKTFLCRTSTELSGYLKFNSSKYGQRQMGLSAQCPEIDLCSRCYNLKYHDVNNEFIRRQAGVYITKNHPTLAL